MKKQKTLFEKGYHLECAFQQESKNPENKEVKQVESLFDRFYQTLKRDPAEALSLLISIADLIKLILEATGIT